ncbi:hypothetical protein [Pannonibacter carbonis]|uniref:hypothetical protein n=1 Tax=Pannonibacter carbonis TaxID=2067569 RepID=UPI000D10ABCB|nr:hypothetical protein [Pannonibacter carbonis]
MFHTYVLTAATRPGGGAKKVDFDRAAYLMDKALLTASVLAMEDERDNYPRHDCTYDAQWVWDYYCERHAEKYGVSFTPDVDPEWDA